MESYATVIQLRGLASFKVRFIRLFDHNLHIEMPVPRQEYDICFPFVRSVCAFDFDIL